MIAAVSTIRGDADIAYRTVAHLFNNGVDEIYIALSTHGSDDTRESLAPFPVNIIHDDEEYHYQPRWTNYLAGMAAEHGAEWIIPFDADEFIYAVEYPTIAEAILYVDPATWVLTIASHQHLTEELRFTDMLGLGKVAYRYHPEAALTNGNHFVTFPFDVQTEYDVLHLRELQFRSYEHMAAKCKERVATIDPSLDWGEGTHQRVLAAMSPEELKTNWENRAQRPTTYDPIPEAT